MRCKTLRKKKKRGGRQLGKNVNRGEGVVRRNWHRRGTLSGGKRQPEARWFAVVAFAGGKTPPARLEGQRSRSEMGISTDRLGEGDSTKVTGALC